MPHRTRPMTGLLLFTGLNVVLVSTISPVYDFVCFLPYWERRCFNNFIVQTNLYQRESRRKDREAALANGSKFNWK